MRCVSPPACLHIICRQEIKQRSWRSCTALLPACIYVIGYRPVCELACVCANMSSAEIWPDDNNATTDSYGYNKGGDLIMKTGTKRRRRSEMTMCVDIGMEMDWDWDVVHAGLDCKHESSGASFVISSFRKVTYRFVQITRWLWNIKDIARYNLHKHALLLFPYQ